MTTKSREQYLHGREDGKLEFKSVRAIEQPRVIERAVCGLLNADGGDVIVGIAEDGERLIPENVEDSERARGVVLDRLLSTIEPPPTLEVHEERDEWGNWLRIAVPKGDAAPYAVKEKHGSFAVFLRVGDRTVPLSWVEVRRRAVETRGARGKEPDAKPIDELHRWETDLRGAAPSQWRGGLVLDFRPDPELSRASFPAEHWKAVEEWVREPARAGLRSTGWHYADGRRSVERIRGKRDWYESGIRDGGYRVLEYSRMGRLRFATATHYLEWKRPDWASEDQQFLYPYVLIETVVSCCVLYAKLLEGARGERGSTRASLVLSGIQGWRLGPGRPGMPSYDFVKHDWLPAYPNPELTPVSHRISTDEVIENPHHLAWLLVADIYRDFGYEDSVIPFYDPRRGTFRFEA